MPHSPATSFFFDKIPARRLGMLVRGEIFTTPNTRIRQSINNENYE